MMKTKERFMMNDFKWVFEIYICKKLHLLRIFRVSFKESICITYG